MTITLTSLRDTIKQNPIYKGIEVHKSLTKAALDHVVPGHICAGIPGVGKSHWINAIGINKRTIKITPKPQPQDFVDQIWPSRNFDGIILDDHDRVITSPKSKEIVKQWMGDDHTIRWGGQPFRIKAAFIWLSNDPRSVFNKDSSMAAIFDRCANGGLFIEGTDQELFEYVIYIATQDNFFRHRDGFSKITKSQAINWFIENRNHVRLLSLRSIHQVAAYIHDGTKPRQEHDPLSPKEHAQLRLTNLLSPTPLREIQGFRHPLEMTGPGIWSEVPRTVNFCAKNTPVNSPHNLGVAQGGEIGVFDESTISRP